MGGLHRPRPQLPPPATCCPWPLRSPSSFQPPTRALTRELDASVGATPNGPRGAPFHGPGPSHCRAAQGTCDRNPFFKRFFCPFWSPPFRRALCVLVAFESASASAISEISLSLLRKSASGVQFTRDVVRHTHTVTNTVSVISTRESSTLPTATVPNVLPLHVMGRPSLLYPLAVLVLLVRTLYPNRKSDSLMFDLTRMTAAVVASSAAKTSLSHCTGHLVMEIVAPPHDHRYLRLTRGPCSSEEVESSYSDWAKPSMTKRSPWSSLIEEGALRLPREHTLKSTEDPRLMLTITFGSLRPPNRGSSSLCHGIDDPQSS